MAGQFTHLNKPFSQSLALNPLETIWSAWKLTKYFYFVYDFVKNYSSLRNGCFTNYKSDIDLTAF
ncbi:hypothetical protein DERP_014390 [Dermatophagoides pteronyssinus]|uniref:Uncharacterized protein n=1 Tax=Dermatophagoides pteronyssinus TaxID=6956 RepID=A0ABQ8J5Z0_DERPT|nr:hypothetical protein DERP_014390 [Dermatophagoides pteronyssinus]